MIKQKMIYIYIYLKKKKKQKWSAQRIITGQFVLMGHVHVKTQVFYYIVQLIPNMNNDHIKNINSDIVYLLSMYILCNPFNN